MHMAKQCHFAAAYAEEIVQSYEGSIVLNCTWLIKDLGILFYSNLIQEGVSFLHNQILVIKGVW